MSGSSSELSEVRKKKRVSGGETKEGEKDSKIDHDWPAE